MVRRQSVGSADDRERQGSERLALVVGAYPVNLCRASPSSAINVEWKGQPDLD
jgi:hypothetical protein